MYGDNAFDQHGLSGYSSSLLDLAQSGDPQLATWNEQNAQFTAAAGAEVVMSRYKIRDFT